MKHWHDFHICECFQQSFLIQIWWRGLFWAGEAFICCTAESGYWRPLLWTERSGPLQDGGPGPRERRPRCSLWGIQFKTMLHINKSDEDHKKMCYFWYLIYQLSNSASFIRNCKQINTVWCFLKWSHVTPVNRSSLLLYKIIARNTHNKAWWKMKFNLLCLICNRAVSISIEERSINSRKPHTLPQKSQSQQLEV